MTESKQEKTAATQAEAPVASDMLLGDPALTQNLLERFDEALRADSKKTYEHFGYALFHSLSDEQALEQLVGMGFKPKDALDHYNLGCRYSGQEKFSEAAKSFAAAMKMEPEFLEAAYNHALALEKAGEAKAAQKAWREVLDKVEDESESAEIKQHLKELADA